MSKLSLMIAALAAVFATASLAGCRAQECQKMLRCCEEVRDHEAVGGACGELAEGVKDPTTCRTVVRTVQAMFEERDEELPKACMSESELRE